MIIELTQKHFGGVCCCAGGSGVVGGSSVEENELEIVFGIGKGVLEGDHSLGIEATTHDSFLFVRFFNTIVNFVRKLSNDNAFTFI